MRYPSSRKQETRDRLLASSRAQAKQGGFATTGVDALMAAIGMTGGAFYSHFDSKQALFAALVQAELAQSEERMAGAPAAPLAPAALQQRLRTYLSRAHAAEVADGCLLPALGPELARASPELRGEVEAALVRIQQAWAEPLGDGATAWATLAQCVGALVLARAVVSETTRDEILAACREAVLPAAASGDGSP